MEKSQAFTVVVEKAPNNYAVFSPDVPGCVATGKTIEETIASYRDALRFHFEGLLEDGIAPPQPKRLKVHLDDGMFEEYCIGEGAFISSVKVEMPQLAAAA